MTKDRTIRTIANGLECMADDPEFTPAAAKSFRFYAKELRTAASLPSDVARLTGALRHVLCCSGTPDDCEACREARELVAE